jgi:chemotaxis protein CheD
MTSLSSPKPHPPTCLPGFEHINRFWDNKNNCFVAKILPGEFYVTRNHEQVATTLGSCVSACIWDEKIGIGGMNHFMLPLTEKEAHEVNWGQRNNAGDATRYGNYAMEHLINEILKHGGKRKNLRAKVFGGGKVMQSTNDVGKKNAEFVLDYLDMENIMILSQDLGNLYPRKLIFAPQTGKVLMKRLETLHNDTIITRETSYRDSIVHKPVEGDIELF